MTQLREMFFHVASSRYLNVHYLYDVHICLLHSASMHTGFRTRRTSIVQNIQLCISQPTVLTITELKLKSLSLGIQINIYALPL